MSSFTAHPDAAIVQSQPGLGVVLAARVLAEFGDDPDVRGQVLMSFLVRAHM